MNNPFRYSPAPEVTKAAEDLIQRIGTSARLHSLFAEGKMLGVLVCSPSQDGLPQASLIHPSHPGLIYLAAFSGTVGGTALVDGFVPPIYDLTDPEGYFRQEERRISELNIRISALSDSEHILLLKKNLAAMEERMEKELQEFRDRMKQSKLEREIKRSALTSPIGLDKLTVESQHEKAAFRRLKALWKERISVSEAELSDLTAEIDAMKRCRAEMSDKLQDWIFRQYIVHNSLGQEKSIAEIFAAEGLTPPGGTGECAAPKLLEYAYRHGLTPVSMGEFWYGKPSDTAVRTHGHFYPSCTSKCGPLLKFMTKGLDMTETECRHTEPVMLYEDECIVVVEKPGGMPSVPGLDGRTSVAEYLEEYLKRRTGDAFPDGSTGGNIYPVHRLDMDTSGIMIFAKTRDAEVSLKRQFEEHSIKKTYTARLCSACIAGPICTHPAAVRDTSHSEIPRNGTIELPLSADYDERPRQKVDFTQGKPALTEYQIVSDNQDGTQDILFRPITGRTHQLRVHSAHPLGLGRPIIGDLLYGGDSHLCGRQQDDGRNDLTYRRLHLHALSITFRHPQSGETLSFSSKMLSY